MNLRTLALASLAIASSLLLAPAQNSASAGAAPAPEPEGYEAFSQKVKQPFDWLSLGADLRVRNEYFKSAVSLSDANPLAEQDVLRLRGRFWATATVVTNLTVNTRLSGEPREWIDPAFTGERAGHTGMEWRYGILDSANVKWDHIMDTPVSFTGGRQDVLLGDYYDWWLVADGTPGDGSWTLFLDSLRLAYEAKEINTRLDLIYINQLSDPGERMPTIGNSGNYTLTDQNEQGVVVYLSNKGIEKTQLDAYFMYKNDDPTRASSFDGESYTMGGKITGTPIDHWSYSVEGAYQFGQRADRLFANRDVEAFGGKARLNYAFNDPLKNQVNLGFEYLSGDDPSTPEDEMFDVLWGRWPRWSELYIYSFPNETLGRIAQINNLWRIGPMWSISPLKGMTASLGYNALFAPEETPTRAPSAAAAALFSNDGNFRGHYLQAVLKHQFTKHLAGHLWGEWVWQGDYYAQDEMMTFLRAEVMFTF
jgi:hypothetical protein